MNTKQKQFINYVVKHTNKANKAMMESIVKGYVVVEGIDDFKQKMSTLGSKAKSAISSGIKSIGSAMSPYISTNSSHLKQGEITGLPKARNNHLVYSPAPLTDEEKQLMYIDRCTITEDHMKFEEACNHVILPIIKTYGTKKFNEIINSPNFKSAYTKGLRMDNIRPNPLTECMVKQMQFTAFMESLANKQNLNLLNNIFHAYWITEAIHSYDTRYLFEAEAEDYDDDDINEINERDERRRFYEAMKSLSNAMCVVMTFIARHGVYPWDQWRRKPEVRQVFAVAGSKNAKYANM